MGSTELQVKERKKLTAWLASAPESAFVLYTIAVSFSVYFSMFAFRKPFTAGEYAGSGWIGLELKTMLVVSQIVGYALSKFIGIKICSEVTRGHRPVLLTGLILWAEAALVLFAIVPPSLAWIPMLLNGLPLGMIWGLVVAYLEGRRTSELLLAGLSCSFIVSSGIVKDFGRFLMASSGVTEWWMPAATGLCFLPLFMVSVWLLDQIPQPTALDVAARVLREPMGVTERRTFVRTFLPGLVLLLGAYFFITAYRDFRDSYAIEIVKRLGLDVDSGLFTKTETLVALGVLVPLALLVCVKDNRLGLLGAFAIMTTGVTLMGLSTLLFDAGKLGGFWWMTLVGLGSYLAYVPYGSVLFDRVIARTQVAGTAVFAIYLADATGYMGSICVQIFKDSAQKEVTRLDFFRGFTYLTSVLGLGMLVASGAYFLRWRPTPRLPDGTVDQVSP